VGSGIDERQHGVEERLPVRQERRVRGAADRHVRRVRQFCRELARRGERHELVAGAAEPERRGADARKRRPQVAVGQYAKRGIERLRRRLAALEQPPPQHVERRAPLVAAVHLQREEALQREAVRGAQRVAEAR